MSTKKAKSVRHRMIGYAVDNVGRSGCQQPRDGMRRSTMPGTRSCRKRHLFGPVHENAAQRIDRVNRGGSSTPQGVTGLPDDHIMEFIS